MDGLLKQREQGQDIFFFGLSGFRAMTVMSSSLWRVMID